jgi:AbiTii
MVTDSLVLQLEKDCMDATTTLLSVLRKALVVANKLNVAKFQNWIELELRGYDPDAQVPRYRVVKGELKAFNPLAGWIPIVFADPEMTKHLSQCKIHQAVGELEALLQSSGTHSSIGLRLRPDVERLVMQSGGQNLQVVIHVTTASMQGVLDQVRTAVLEWCLKLEQAGIQGEGMSFSADEKKSASQINYIVNFHGEAAATQIQQGTSESSQFLTSTADIGVLRSLMTELSKVIGQLGLQSKEQKQLAAELESMKAQLESPKPNNSVIRECLKSIRNILEGCAGSVIASAFLQRVVLFLS